MPPEITMPVSNRLLTPGQINDRHRQFWLEESSLRDKRMSARTPGKAPEGCILILRIVSGLANTMPVR
jgi:hypothetical protein